MKNYIAEFMKDNGLTEQQGFKIKNNEDRIFFIEKNELFCIESRFVYSNTLLDLLRGKLEIEHLPFKPKDGELVYYYNYYDYDIANTQFIYKNGFDLNNYKMGNCFRTRKECELAIPRLKQMYDEIKKELAI